MWGVSMRKGLFAISALLIVSISFQADAATKKKEAKKSEAKPAATQTCAPAGSMSKDRREALNIPKC